MPEEKERISLRAKNLISERHSLKSPAWKERDFNSLAYIVYHMFMNDGFCPPDLQSLKSTLSNSKNCIIFFFHVRKNKFNKSSSCF